MRGQQPELELSATTSTSSGTTTHPRSSRVGPRLAGRCLSQVSGSETTGTAIGGDIATNARGDVFAVWPDTGSQTLYLVKSNDGGKSWTNSPIAVSKTFRIVQISVPSFAEQSALIGASIAAFSGGGRNDVYVSWVDLSGDPGASPGSEPGDDATSTCKSRVWFIRSTDGGDTWSEKAQQLSPGSTLNDQFNQKLPRRSRLSGTLGIVYFDTHADSHRKKANLVFQASADHGANWSKQLTSHVVPERRDKCQAADSGNQYGDYNGLTVLSGTCSSPRGQTTTTRTRRRFSRPRSAVPPAASGLPAPRGSSRSPRPRRSRALLASPQ